MSHERFILELKNDVRMPLRYGAVDAYFTIRSRSIVAHPWLVLAESACEGGRCPKWLIWPLIDLTLTFP